MQQTWMLCLVLGLGLRETEVRNGDKEGSILTLDVKCRAKVERNEMT